MDSRSDSQFADQLWALIQADHVIRLPYVGGEYYLDALDEVAYQFMVRDSLRNNAYRRVIQQRVGGKIVVEIGPGSRMFMTLMCVEAGARLVYAIEASETAYHKAQALVVQAGVQEKVVLIPGWSTEVDIPELADVCLSELIGPIGNAEGASRSLNNAKRFLKPDGVMIPAGCLTWVSPVSKPPNGYDAPWLAEPWPGRCMRRLVMNFPLLDMSSTIFRSKISLRRHKYLKRFGLTILTHLKCAIQRYPLPYKRRPCLTDCSYGSICWLTARR